MGNSLRFLKLTAAPRNTGKVSSEHPLVFFREELGGWVL